MQAFIDMAVAAMKVWFASHGGYHERPFVGWWDWTQLTLVMDGAWHELDLSGIIPEGVKAVNIFGVGQHAEVHKHVKVSPLNVALQKGSTLLRTVVANVAEVNRIACGVTTDRKFYYLVEAPNWDQVYLQIKGWWF